MPESDMLDSTPTFTATGGLSGGGRAAWAGRVLPAAAGAAPLGAPPAGAWLKEGAVAGAEAPAGAVVAAPLAGAALGGLAGWHATSPNTNAAHSRRLSHPIDYHPAVVLTYAASVTRGSWQPRRSRR